MNHKNETLFWKKKEFISFISSILVLFIHSYFAPEIVSNSFISAINHKFSFFFSRSITQFAVPMFFMLSGISFFKEYNNKKYQTKIKSRIYTLVIPYLLWNTVWMLWEIFGSYSFISKFFATGEPYPLTLVSILKGILFYGCNIPFWFLFDIIVFSFAAPLLFLIIRNKYIGIAFVACLSIISVFGIHLPMNFFYYPMSIVFYLTGAIIGYHFFDYASRKSSKPMQITSIVLFSAYILAKNIVPRELHISNYLMEAIVYTIAAFCLWNIADIFIERIKPRAIYRRSFAIYAMHLNVAIITLKILSLFAPQNEWLQIPKFLIMVVFTLVIINYICAFLEKFFPGIYALFMGNRIKKRQ
ncbi:MAG: acyltransferase [Clostridia bacterium]|nr:acyltransferase [Clostridia bacterium]